MENKFENLLSYRDCFADNKEVKSFLVYDGDMDCQPIVSIMIPTFRRPELLGEAIESALTQKTNIPFEVVVVDNENDPLYVRQVNQKIEGFGDYRLRLFRNEKNIGMFGNWNRCLELSRGKYLTILSDDDILKQNFVHHAISNLSKREFVAVNTDHFGPMLPTTNKANIFKDLLKLVRDRLWYRNGFREIKLADVMVGNPVTGILGVLFDKEAAISIGGFKQECFPSSDYVFITNYWLKFGGKILKNSAAAYRWEANESFNPDTVHGFLKLNKRLRKQVISVLGEKLGGLRLYQLTASLQDVLQASLYAQKFSLSDKRFKDISSELPVQCKVPFPQALSWMLLFSLHVLPYICFKGVGKIEGNNFD